MKSRKLLSSLIRTAGALTLCASVLYAVEASAATKSKTKSKRAKRPITKPKFDASAERVKLFDGLKKGTLTARVIAKDSLSGRVLIENKTKKPLTVELPPAIVGVQVLKQGIGGAGGGMGQGGAGAGYGGGQGQGQGQGGQNQQFGGGFGGGGGQQGGYGGGGGLGAGGGQGQGGFFSIPPERVVAVPYKSVCLEHGKKDPTPRTKYRLVKVEDYTKNKQLQTLLKMVGTGRLDSQTAQAAAWHLANNMSWRQLAMKQQRHIGRAATRYFHPTRILRARNLVAIAEKKSRETDTKQVSTPVKRTRQRRRFRR